MLCMQRHQYDEQRQSWLNTDSWSRNLLTALSCVSFYASLNGLCPHCVIICLGVSLNICWYIKAMHTFLFDLRHELTSDFPPKVIFNIMTNDLCPNDKSLWKLKNRCCLIIIDRLNMELDLPVAVLISHLIATWLPRHSASISIMKLLSSEQWHDSWVYSLRLLTDLNPCKSNNKGKTYHTDCIFELFLFFSRLPWTATISQRHECIRTSQQRQYSTNELIQCFRVQDWCRIHDCYLHQYCFVASPRRQICRAS